MRRARVKVLATVPARRKTLPDIPASLDSSIVFDQEHADEDVSITEISEQETVKNNEQIKEDKLEQNKECSTAKLKFKPSSVLPEIERNPELNTKSVIEQSNFQETSLELNKSQEINDQLIQKSFSSPDVTATIDIVSPTKVTQGDKSRSCFMRPSPRLDAGGRVRKNSIQGSGARESASESEDDSKKTTAVIPSRIRSNSTCSIQSNKDNAVSDNQYNIGKIKTTQKRRMLVSESARKLAEARREFLLKHENKTPDRSQLKMYDLIYYNPVTNPMKKSRMSTVISRRISIAEPDRAHEEEDEDDPSSIPVPQVKVGPDGQLIIDEQSLVIEQTAVIKGKKMLAQEPIMEDDTYGGGFYKKRQKSKEWPKWETFKFYRALNVVGTDFLLMQSLFPNRTRQQIKQKYKKEERVNRHLVEKALKYHQEFDTEMLEKQLAMLQNLENIQVNVDTSKRPPEKDKNMQRENKSAMKRGRRLVATSIGECGVSSVSNQETEDRTALTIDDDTDEEINTDHQQTRKRKRHKSKKRLDHNPDKSNDNSSTVFDDNDVNVDSESDPEVYQVRPTRSGRLPKVKKLQGPNVNTLDSGVENDSFVERGVLREVPEIENGLHASEKNNESLQTSCSERIATVMPDINRIEPGSLVILSKESVEEPGNTILQVYMVSSNIENSNKVDTPEVTSVELSPELLTTSVTTTTVEDEPINVVDDCE